MPQISQKRTKIIATLGPASDSADVILRLFRAGVNVFRLNFSHGSHEYHRATLSKIRDLERAHGVQIGVLQDICGPKIRVCALAKTFELKKGDELIFSDDGALGVQENSDRHRVSINQRGILPLLKIGEMIFLCDGMIAAKVVKTGEVIHTIVQNDGILSSNKGVNFPDTRLNIDVITKKDEADLLWGAQNGVDFVALSFVQNANDVHRARKILNEHKNTAKLFSKIEKFDAIENIDEIIAASDGVMVARGDLGIEVPYFKVPPLQKMIIKKCNEKNVPVITATQMMFSMAKNEKATRAEISDVANAVLDGSDAVMLSEESAVGVNPVAVVQAMSATIMEAEKFYPYGNFYVPDPKNAENTAKISSATLRLAQDLGADAIISITRSGQSAVKISRNRPRMKILAITHDEKTARSLSIVWGVHPCAIVEPSEKISGVVRGLLAAQKIHENATYVITAGHKMGVPGSTNFIWILQKDEMNFYANELQSGSSQP